MILKNEYIQIKVDQVGAELISLIDLGTDVEYMWQKSSTWWNRTSPVLFPFIGVTNHNQIKIEGKTYPTTKHGFLRDKIMDVIVGQDTLEFIYTSNKEDFAVYPYKFKLSMIYKLQGRKVHIQYVLENLNDYEMLYSLGGHPAFNFSKGDVAIYEGNDAKRYELEGPFISEIHPENVSEIVLDETAFSNDAIIHSGIHAITLKSKDKSIRVDFSDFDYVGLWSMIKEDEMAPFVCVEPWHGLPDFVGYEGELSQKLGIQKVEAQGKVVLNLSLEI